MKGGVILFRGGGTAARRYLEADRSQADDYYLEHGTVLASFTITDATGETVVEAGLDPEQYARWVDWTHPLTGESMGTPRLPGEGRRGSPRFAEMVVNTPKSLSIAAALHPEVSAALADAAAEICRWLAQHSVTRVGPRGAQEVVPVEALQTVAVTHHTSRAGDPHRHVHFQIGTRVQAAGGWRALDTAALFKQQGAIRALGTAVIAAHPQLADVLDRHGLQRLDAQTADHQAEADDSDTALAAAEEHAATIRAQITEPLTVQARADGRDYLEAVTDEAEATARLRTAGRLGRRRAEHDHQAAQDHAETMRGRLRVEWGSLPAGADALTEWAAGAAAERAEHNPHVTETMEAVNNAKTARQGVTERQRRERLALLSKLHGPERVRRNPIRYQLTDPHRETARWQATADHARREAARLRALPPDQAARQITAKRAEAEAARQAAAERARRLRTTPQEPATTREPGRDGPELGR